MGHQVGMELLVDRLGDAFRADAGAAAVFGEAGQAALERRGLGRLEQHRPARQQAGLGAGRDDLGVVEGQRLAQQALGVAEPRG